MLQKLRIGLLIALVIGICVPVMAQERNPVELLQWVDKSDPLKDAKKAVAAEDFTLYLVHSDRSWLPGVPEGKDYYYRSKLPIKLIEGTSDCLKNDEHWRLNDKAIAYARAYNRYVLKYLKPKHFKKQP